MSSRCSYFIANNPSNPRNSSALIFNSGSGNGSNNRATACRYNEILLESDFVA